jgi:DNA-binding phage protein
MSKSKVPVKLLPFDAARYLTDDAAVAEYTTAVLETDDPDLLLLALGDVARARGMAQVAGSNLHWIVRIGKSTSRGRLLG